MLHAARGENLFVYIGTHTAGPGKGFSLAHFDTTTGALTKPEFLLEAPAPAYFIIAPDGKHLYTCNSTGFVSAYAIDRATARLTLLNQVPSGGGDPSYISLDQNRAIRVRGQLRWREMWPRGSCGPMAASASGRRLCSTPEHGVNPQRQSHAFAHSIRVDLTNRFVLVADLGLDKLFVYKFDVKTGSVTPNDPPFVTVKPGSGARHMVFHPNGRWVYLITEMGSTIIQFEWDSTRGTLKELQTVSTLPADFHGNSACSEITIHPNGKFLYASNRGHDSIAVFAIDAQSGRLTPVEYVPSGGKTPRNFALDRAGRWMTSDEPRQ